MQHRLETSEAWQRLSGLSVTVAMDGYATVDAFLDDDEAHWPEMFGVPMPESERALLRRYIEEERRGQE